MHYSVIKTASIQNIEIYKIHKNIYKTDKKIKMHKIM